MYILY